MKKIFSVVVLIISYTTLFSQIPTGYYNGTDGLEGDALRMKLRTIIKSGHKKNSYDALYGYYKKTDNFGSNKVWDMYSMDGSGNANYYYYFDSNSECGSYSGEGDCYNREHSVPQSWFGSEGSTAKADLFIVVPSDGYVNGRRSNLPYGEVSNPSWTSSNGSKRGNCTFPGYSSACFEPIDAYKGDFARAYFYVVTRYNVSSWNGASFSGDGFSSWTKELLLKWSNEDPISEKEINKNNEVYKIQKNRNPYIDHPEWINCVFGNGCGIGTPSNFIANVISTSEIDLSWALNSEGNDILLAYSNDGVFGTPTGSYTAGQTISGGGIVLYVGNNTSFSHTGLTAQAYHYRLWSVKDAQYSPALEAVASPLLGEPSANATNFTVSNTTSISLSLSWTDATGAIKPLGYLIRCAKTAEEIQNPTDGVAYPDNNNQKNILYGKQKVTFANLTPHTQYFFKIYPYSNSGNTIDYKIDNTPQTNGTTNEASAVELFISEIASKGYNSNYNDEYIEITNLGSSAVDMTDITLEYYENTTLEANLNLTGQVAANSAYVVAVRTSFDAISPNFIPTTSFHLNKNCHVELKRSGEIIDKAGTLSDEFIKNNNYEFVNLSVSNEPTANWNNLVVANGTPGEVNVIVATQNIEPEFVNIYPNPTTDYFRIKMESSGANITIFDVNGHIIKKIHINGKEEQIDVSNIERGIVFVKIEQKNKVIWKKIIKL